MLPVWRSRLISACSQLKAGVEQGEVFLPFADVGVLLFFRCGGDGRGSLELDGDDLKLLLREELVETSDLGAGLELERGSIEAKAAFGEEIALGIRIVFGAKGVSGGLACLRAVAVVEDGDGELDTDAEGVLLEGENFAHLIPSAEVLLEVGVLDGAVAAVLGAEGDLRAQQVTRIAEGDLTLGAGAGVGGVDPGRGGGGERCLGTIDGWEREAWSRARC